MAKNKSPFIIGRIYKHKEIIRLALLVLALFSTAFICMSVANAADDSTWTNPYAEGEDWINHVDDWETLPPDKVSESDFYRAEYALIAGSSGSGGYFLERDQMSWLARSVKSLEQRGIKPVDHFERRNVYRDSFYHLKQDAQKPSG